MSRIALLPLALLLATITACSSQHEITAPADDLLLPNAASPVINPPLCPPTCVGQIWTKQYVGALPGTISAVANDVSNNGTVVGTSNGAGGYVRPFVWTASAGIKKLPFPPGPSRGVALAISDNGRYATGYVLDTSGKDFPVRWALGPTPTVVAPKMCGQLLYDHGRGEDVNNAGVVAGNMFGRIGTYWPDPTRCPVATSGNGAFGINDVGSIVGDGSYVYQYRPFPLMSQLPTSVTRARAINASGRSLA